MTPPPRTRRASAARYAAALLCLTTIAAAPWVAILLALLLGPALLVLLLDQSPGKPVARYALLGSASVAIAPLHLLLQHGGNPGTTPLTSPGTLLAAWIAAIAGPLIAEAAPAAAAALRRRAPGAVGVGVEEEGRRGLCPSTPLRA